MDITSGCVCLSPADLAAVAVATPFSANEHGARGQLSEHDGGYCRFHTYPWTNRRGRWWPILNRGGGINSRGNAAVVVVVVGGGGGQLGGQSSRC